MSNWDAVALKHGTDKSSAFHDYVEDYERTFGNEKIAALLEIGVDRGNSLRTWCELFPSARVVGVDINPTCADVQTDATVVIADATTTDTAEALRSYAPWDVVIDDGSHQIGDVLASLALLLPLVRPGGWYAIEDIVIGCPGAPMAALLGFLAGRDDVAEIWVGRSRVSWGVSWPGLAIVRRA